MLCLDARLAFWQPSRKSGATFPRRSEGVRSSPVEACCASPGTHLRRSRNRMRRASLRNTSNVNEDAKDQRFERRKLSLGGSRDRISRRRPHPQGQRRATHQSSSSSRKHEVTCREPPWKRTSLYHAQSPARRRGVHNQSSNGGIGNRSRYPV